MSFKSIKILRVSALLNGRKTVDYSGLFILEHMLWDKPEDKKTVRQTIITTLTEGVRAASDIEEKIKIIAEQIFEKQKYPMNILIISMSTMPILKPTKEQS